MSNIFYPMWRPSDENAEFLNKGSEAINVGDLLYWDSSNNCVRSASNFADQGSAAAQQLAMAPWFLGVAMSAALSTDATTRAVRVLVDDVYEFPCDSGTFAIGDYVSFSYSSGARNQQVVGVGNHATAAIGRVVKRYSSATTKVKCRIMSPLLNGIVTGQQNPYGLLKTATVAAAGNSQGTAAALTAEINQVTGSDGTKGVILPAAQPGMELKVFNNVAAACIVYGNTGAAINGGAANASYSVTSNKNAIFTAFSTTSWQAVVSSES